MASVYILYFITKFVGFTQNLGTSAAYKLRQPLVFTGIENFLLFHG